MNKKILVINAGSSSIKFRVYNYDDLNELGNGLCERIFVDGHIKVKTADGKVIEKDASMPDHTAAVQIALDALKELKIIEDLNDIVGIGHRIAMGGKFFKESTIVDDEKILNKAIEYGKIAPLHNPCETTVIKVFKKLVPNAYNVGVFDTSYHSTIPAVNSDYCLDRTTTEKYEIKKYGFHGTSYRYIVKKMEEVLGKKNPNLIVCHIGNGASICAIKDGKSYDTTMGLSPLQGLIMGTRCGDIDASVCTYLLTQGLTGDQVNAELNKKAGFLGVAGSSDSRDVIAKANAGDANAKLAREIQLQRIANYVVQYANELGQVDAIVFTAGCGENDAQLLEGVCDRIKLINLKYDSVKNQGKYSDYLEVTGAQSQVRLFRVRTNEELMIAGDVKALSHKK
ncbi:MAG: acetate/propionate family kinase [Mycoplasmoidaceae bacterium]|nr:acetate/propionate family kinase [Mycoplasmoidaceae bacterium]